MSNVQAPDSVTDAEMRERAAAQEHERATRAPVGPRRRAGLVLAAALLLALAFATGRASDRLWPAGRAGGAPAAVGQTIAADGYMPNALDYREDHRVAAPAYGTDGLNYREDHRLDLSAVPPLADDGYTPTRMDYREDHRLAPRPPRAGLRFLEQNTQLPAAGAAAPVSIERQRFLERNTQFPTGGAPTSVPGPSTSPKGPR